MKKLLLLLALFSLVYVQLNAQESSIKDFQLNGYIAPDIKYRALDLSAYFSSSGSHIEENKSFGNSIVLEGDLLYYSYSNTKKHQGINSSNLITRTSFGNNKNDNEKSNDFGADVFLDYYSQNRIYYKNNVFCGLHGGNQFTILGGNSNTSNDLESSYNEFELTINPYISLGKGKVQPIYSARKAQDILISLEKYGRLKRTPTPLEIDSLARVANRIKFKRFYDSRFKRIYQLEELDKALQGMGLIDSADIVYFANLSDIWSFAGNRERGSGTRFEGGIIPQVILSDYDRNYFSEFDGNTIERSEKRNTQSYGAYGFLSFNYFEALSFSWQSDFFLDFTIGHEWYEENKVNTVDSLTYTWLPKNQESWNALLNISWQIGYIPNTRTSLTLTPYTSFSYGLSHSDNKKEMAGINAGFMFNSYYYLSPRFRIRVSANFAYYSDFTNTAPSPFWNVVSYHNDYKYRQTNDVVQSQLPNRNNNILIRNGFDYSFRFTISYALF